ncbi:MAG: hypothetical protein ABI378_15680 [Chitinophagaceae bacterium]
MMKYIILLLIFLSFCLPANALLKQHHSAAAKTQTAFSSRINTEYQFANFQTEPRVRKYHPTDEDRYYSSIEGMVAFTSTILSLACFIALSITSVQFFIIPALAFATLATVLGTVGLTRMKPGYAIIGLVVGLIEIVAGFAVLANLPPL